MIIKKNFNFKFIIGLFSEHTKTSKEQTVYTKYTKRGKELMKIVSFIHLTKFFSETSYYHSFLHALYLDSQIDPKTIDSKMTLQCVFKNNTKLVSQSAVASLASSYLIVTLSSSG